MRQLAGLGIREQLAEHTVIERLRQEGKRGYPDHQDGEKHLPPELRFGFAFLNRLFGEIYQPHECRRKNSERRFRGNYRKRQHRDLNKPVPVGFPVPQQLKCKRNGQKHRKRAGLPEHTVIPRVEGVAADNTEPDVVIRAVAALKNDGKDPAVVRDEKADRKRHRRIY